MISRRTVLTASLALGIAAATPWKHTAWAQGDRILQIASLREISSLDLADTSYHFRRLRVAETLVTIDPEGKLAPELAQSWSVSDDGLAWTFVIREGVRFHDGSVLTPEIVRVAIEAMRKANTNAELVSRLPISDVRVKGQAVVVTLERPFSLVPDFFTDGPAVILAPSSFAADGTVAQIIGTGPYRITEIEGKTLVKLEAFPDYWGEQPHITRVHFTGAASTDTIANMAEARQADLVLGVPPALRDRVEASGVRIKRAQTARIFGIIFNAEDGRFNGPAERRAISLALDRQGIAAALFGNGAAAANQLFSSAFPNWYDPNLPQIERNVDEAKRILAEAGWAAGPDGILTRDGTRFSFTAIAQKRFEIPLLAEAVQAQLAEVGIKVNVELGGAGQVLESVANGSFVFGFTPRNYGAVPDPVATLVLDYGAENAATSPWSGINYRNPEMQSGLNAYLAARNKDEVTEARNRLLAIVNSGDLPVVPLVWSDYYVSVSERVDVDSVPVDALEVSFWIDRVRWAE
ncbi:ABC transporter substrate-binding protein [Phyllobacterium sp. 22229]|uniref:ABC transporter substrate-binding protein n=1 Tax=Agrobacterium radiobacter TaxID=362 RepID=A0ABD5LQD1_AGRRD